MCAPSLGTPPDARRLFREVWALSLHGANIDVSFVEGERHPLSKTAQFTPEQLKKLRPLLCQVAQKQYERLYRFTAGDLDGKGHLLGVFFLWQTASRVSNGTFKFHVDDTLPGNVKGVITSPYGGPVTSFNIDPSSCSSYEITNRLWGMMESSP